MLQDVQVKLQPGLSLQSSVQQEEDFSKLDLNLRKNLAKCYIWSIALCGAELGHFGK
jgi:hypothetical protein